MRLLTLSLQNFKGALNVVVAPMGMDLTVFADNGVGKTTLADALFWLLFDKDSQGRKAFGIKTVDEAGRAIPMIDHSVEAEFDLDGERLSLRKVYREDHKKKRGNATAVFDGHETDHFVNTVPVAKGEYVARVREVCTEARFRTLTDPTYFVEGMEWKERRAMLLEVCGDVTDADVIAAKRELAPLPAILGRHSIDDHRKILGAGRKEANAELDRIPAQIGEVDRGLPSVPNGNWAETLAGARQALAAAQAKRSDLSSGGELLAKRNRALELQGERRAIANRMRSQPDPARATALAKARTLDAAIAAGGDGCRSLHSRIAGGRSDMDRLSARRASLLAEHKADRESGFAGDSTCPSCGQALPEEAVQKATEAFNQAKARRLGEITERGKRVRADLDALTAQVEGWESDLMGAEADLERIAAEREALAIPDEAFVDPAAEPEYRKLAAEASTLAQAIRDMEAGGASRIAEADAEIRDAQVRVDEAAGHVLAAKHRAGGLERIEELKAREKALAAEIERIEREQTLTETFVRTKVRMLDERINSRFAVARFKLFRDQLNEGLQEVCEVMAPREPGGPLVEYRDLNHGMRVNVGLDVVDTLAAHFGFAPFIVVDNAESVTRIRPTRGQQIRLVVSAADKALRCVTSEREPAPIPEDVPAATAAGQEPEEALF